MTLLNVSSNEVLPSSALGSLQSLIGQTLSSVAQYEVEDDYGLGMTEAEVLTQGEGPLLFHFGNGVVLGFGNQPSQNSVTLWLERDGKGHERPEGTLNDPEMRAVSLDAVPGLFDLDRILGQRVTAWVIYRGSPPKAIYQGLPNERAVVLTLESGERLVIGHGLLTNSDDLRLFPWPAVEEVLAGMQPLSPTE